MALTPTQANFIVQLGVLPNPGLFDRPMNALITGPATDYVKHEQEALDALANLRNLPDTGRLAEGFEKQIAGIQKDVAEAKRITAPVSLRLADNGIVSVGQQIGTVAQRVRDNAPFFADLETSTKMLERLRAHAQRDHITDKIDLASHQLQLARDSALMSGEMTAAATACGIADTACTQGLDFAANYGDFALKRSEAVRAEAAAKAGFSATSTIVTGWDKVVEQATALAAPTTRNYPRAKWLLQQCIDTTNTAVDKHFLQDADKEVIKLVRMAKLITKTPADDKTTGGVDGDITDMRVLLAKATVAGAGGNTAEALMFAREVYAAISTADKIVSRRLDYDADRKATIAEMNKVKGEKTLLGQSVSLQKLLERADGLATRKVLLFEEGSAQLADIKATCGQLLGEAKVAKDYAVQRRAAEDALQQLRNSPGSEALGKQAERVRQLLDQAKAATGDITGPEPGDPDWKAAIGLAAAALKEAQSAAALLPGLKDTEEALNDAKWADQPEDVQKSVAAIRRLAEAAKGQLHANAAAVEFPKIEEALRAAEQAASDKAADFLEAAATSVQRVRIIQAEAQRFADEQTVLLQRLNALTALTDPPAAKLAGRITAFERALGEAQRLRATPDVVGSLTALRDAEAAAAAAEQTRDDRKAFDTEAARIGVLRDGLTGTAKTDVTKMLASAEKEADGFDFNYAARFLENAEAQVDGQKVAGLAQSAPDDPELMKAVMKMLGARGGQELARTPSYTPKTDQPDPVKAREAKSLPGGAELLDAVVAKFGDAVSMRVLAKITEARFGIQLSVSRVELDGAGKAVEKDPSLGKTDMGSDAPGFDTQRSRSARRLYDMMAKVPSQSEKNPSMAKVERHNALRADATGKLLQDVKAGGYYDSSKNLVVMNGRPGASDQKFGTSLGQLPAVDPGYEPVDEAPVDYFDFASVHEVGHAVDDRMGFMSSRLGDPAFGNWTSYGGNLSPIIDAVAGDVIARNGGADQAALKAYVRDLIAGGSAKVPGVAPDVEEATNLACKAAAKWHKTATNGRLWWVQSDVDAVTIGGIVYQEAYKATWVSYPAAERKKGITGYQFRAPGEWFAELYAAYHMGKLKNGHPARRWLSTLSI